MRRYVQAYSGIFSTLCKPRILVRHPCHIVSPGIFRTGGLSKPCEKFTRHIQNPAMGITQPYSEPYATLAYAKTWFTQNPGIFKTLP